MQKNYCLKNAISFFKKGIALSLLVLLSVTGYSGPGDEYTARKAGCHFLVGGPSLIAWPNSKGEGAYSTGDCTYSLSSEWKQVPGETGSEQVTVTTGASCAWAVSSNVGWITITSNPITTGSGSLSYSYAENNSNFVRRGRIIVAGKIYTVVQVPRSLTPDRYEDNNTVAKASLLTATFTQNASTISISANCHNVDDVDIYKIVLGPGYSYTATAVLYEKYNQINNTNYTLEAKISYSTNGSNWKDQESPQFLSMAVQERTLYLKIESYDKQYDNASVGDYAAKIDIRITSTAGCAYSLSATSQAVAAPAGSGKVEVTTTPSCVWTAASHESWIKLTSGGTTGSGSVDYSYTGNASADSRTGTITVAGQTYTVTQSPPSSDRHEPNNTVEQATTVLVPEFTQNMSIISISGTCHSDRDIDIYKINFAVGSTYQINGRNYTWNYPADNGGYYHDAQSFRSTDGSTWSYNSQWWEATVQGGALYLKIVPHEGQVGPYSVRMDVLKITADCTYSLSPTFIRTTSAAASNQVNVTTGTSCAWTATTNENWITLTSSQIITGSGSVRYSFTENTSTSSRMGGIMVGALTYSVIQAPRSLSPDKYEDNNTVEQATPVAPVFTQNMGAISISANCHNVDDVDFYKINLETGHSYTVSGVLYDGKNQISDIFCPIKISYSTNGSTWRSKPEDGRFSGLTAQGHLYLKIESDHKWGIDSYSVKMDVLKITSDCTYTLLPANKQTTFQAGSDQIAVTTGPLCAWTANAKAHTDAYWITLTSSQITTGTGSVGYSYAENNSPSERTGTITVAGQAFTVTQSPLTPDNYEDNNTVDKATALTPTYTQNAGTLSISANYHNVDDVDFYKINLKAEYSHLISGLLSDSKFRMNSYDYTISQISYSTDGSTWSKPEDLLSGLIVQGGTLYLKIQPRAKEYWSLGSYVAKIDIIDICTVTPAVTNKQVTDGAGFDRVDVRAGSSCAWTASTKETWITLTSGQSTTGSGSVGFSYTENTTTSPRIGMITIGDRNCTVTQNPHPLIPDSYEENNTVAQATPLTPAFTQNASTLAISANCHQVDDVDIYKINFESGDPCAVNVALYYRFNQNDNSSYTLNAEISYSTNGSTWRYTDRELWGMIMQGGTLYLKIQSTKNVGTYAMKIGTRIAAKADCTYNLSATSKKATGEAGSDQVTVTAASSCYWTATSNAEWITLTSDQSTTGSGSVGFSYTESASSYSRTGTISIANQTYTITQAANPCDYFFSKNSIEVGPESQEGTVEVKTRSVCSWEATPNVTWITLSPNSGKGNSKVTYKIEKNSIADRVGFINIGGLNIPVTQSLIAGIETPPSVKIFPNPSKDFVIIDLSSNNIKWMSIKISNQLGQILYEVDNPNGKQQIPLKGFTAGLYFILLQGEEKAWVQKLIVE